jgi:hypothetical protein
MANAPVLYDVEKCCLCAKSRNMPIQESYALARACHRLQVGDRRHLCAYCGVPSAEHTADAAVAGQCSASAAVCNYRVQWANEP